MAQANRVLVTVSDGLRRRLKAVAEAEGVSESGAIRMAIEDFVELREGPVIPAAAIKVALELEELGCKLTAKADGTLTMSNQDRLTPELRERARTYRLHLLALAAYQAPARETWAADGALDPEIVKHSEGG